MTRASLFTLAVVLAAVAGCPASGQSRGASSPSSNHATTCKGAALTLSPQTIVAEFNGAAVTMKDLGPELVTAEAKALAAYCDAIDGSRRQALENHITEALVALAAKSAGKTPEEYVRARVDAAAKPSDAEIQSFYDTNKREGAPPLEDVRGQISGILSRQTGEKAINDMVEELMKTAKVERKLPDVRSPPVELPTPSYVQTKGKAGASVKVVEFADFQCPYCSRAADTMSALNDKYGDRVEFSYRHFPLRQIHPSAQHAAEVAQCAAAQGKFWEMHKTLYANQQALDPESTGRYAGEIGLDTAKFAACLTAGAATAEVEQDLKLGESVGVEGTPSFFINGHHFTGNPTPEDLGAAIETELKGS